MLSRIFISNTTSMTWKVNQLNFLENIYFSLISWQQHSDKFWCWKRGHACQSSIQRCSKMSLTFLLTSSCAIWLTYPWHIFSWLHPKEYWQLVCQRPYQRHHNIWHLNQRKISMLLWIHFQRFHIKIDCVGGYWLIPSINIQGRK